MKYKFKSTEEVFVEESAREDIKKLMNWSEDDFKKYLEPVIEQKPKGYYECPKCNTELTKEDIVKEINNKTPLGIELLSQERINESKTKNTQKA